MPKRTEDHRRSNTEYLIENCVLMLHICLDVEIRLLPAKAFQSHDAVS